MTFAEGTGITECDSQFCSAKLLTIGGLFIKDSDPPPQTNIIKHQVP